MTWGQFHNPNFVRGAKGLFVSRDALDRFREKCEFDPLTGCVLWTGAKCWGRGKTIRYGSFRDGKKVWLAHRWSAKNIHGFDIDGLQVDHCCPMYRAGSDPLLPNHLCVEHVQPLSDEKNRWLQTERRRHFVHLEVGLFDYEEIYGSPQIIVPDDALPFYEPPAWLKPHVESDDCPF